MKLRTRKAKHRLVQNWCNQHGGTTCKISEWAVGKLKNSYAKFSARYGRRGAVAIMAAMAVTMPLPGNIFAVLGVAEGVRALSSRMTGNASIADIIADVRELAEQLDLPFDEKRFVEAYQQYLTTNEARSEMPQIRKEHFEEFLDYVKDHTSLTYEDAVDPHNLNAIQSEYDQERVDAIPDEKLKWPILTSKDGYVLDGNHRWIRAGQKGVTIPVLRIGLDRDEALELARSFPKAQYVENWCNQYGGDTCKDGRSGPTERVQSKREKVEKRKQEAEASVDSKTKIVNTFVAGLNAASELHSHVKGMYLDNVYAVVDNMPQAAIDRISSHLKKVDFFKNPKALGLTAKANPDVMRKVRSGEVMIGGYYSTGENRLALDGGTRTLTAVGVYAHEMTHAIDGPNFEISRSSEWSSAFLHEFSNGQLTKYGATKPSEALAEFGRALYGERVPVETLREKYPRAVAVFESRGLLPPRPGSTHNATVVLTELFSEYIETDDGHADALLDTKPVSNRLSARAKRKLANNARKTMPGPNKIDPTRTTNIRSSFIKKLRAKFALLRGKVRSLVVTEDAFGLQAGNDLKMATNRYQFKTSPQKIEEFQKWLRQQFRSTLTGKTDEQLWKEFARQGYLKGAGRAFDDVERELDDAGPRKRLRRFGPGEGAFYQGSRAEFLRSSFGRPETVEKIQLLAGRSFDDLENVTEDMATRMSRTLTDGLSQGMNPREVAQLLDDDLELGSRRAEVIARTEIIRAHAEGQLDSMKSMGVQTVGAEVEWSTAGDGRVCPDCSEMEGKIYSIDDARGLIPMHPQCRCAWLPAGFDKLTSEGGDE